MNQLLSKIKVTCVVAAVAAFAALGFAPGASAHMGEYAKFDFCPSTNPSVFKCLHSVTKSGTVVLGKKSVPIVNPVTLQGGVSEPNEETGFSEFFGATNSVTLSKAPQPVPGGLVGLVPPESAPPLVKAALKLVLENGFTGVNSTLELAGSPSEIRVNEFGLVFEEGVALELPVKVHLENPLLGGSCYVGSDSAPIIWNLTTGATSPPSPNESIHGFSGTVESLEGGGILGLNDTKLVDNAWPAPAATGCGGPLLEGLVNPIVGATSGLPAAAGTNTAILNNDTRVALAETVNEH